jgi:hypothetical protein
MVSFLQGLEFLHTRFSKNINDRVKRIMHWRNVQRVRKHRQGSALLVKVGVIQMYDRIC